MPRQREPSDGFVVRRIDDARLFHRIAWEPLLQRECENCVPIGVLGRIVDGRGVPSADREEPNEFYVVESSHSEPVLFALRTPPRQLLITTGPTGAPAALANELMSSGWNSEFVGPEREAREFAEAYGIDRVTPGTKMRLFDLTAVIDPPAACGEMRLAEISDLELLAKWRVAFSIDVGMLVRDDGIPGARAAIEERRAFFWTVDGRPVATTGIGGETPNSVRISAVYTPPKNRGHGYATSLVAAVSRRMLESGRRYCTLFTDRSNPTSNGIYQKIGYHAVADFEQWKPAGAP
jgi:predicted GNAT family acetyltransferase